MSNIYKSPNPNECTQTEHNDTFIDYLDTHLYNLSVYNYDAYVFTDSNANLLNLNNNNTTARYLEKSTVMVLIKKNRTSNSHCRKLFLSY